MSAATVQQLGTSSSPKAKVLDKGISRSTLAITRKQKTDCKRSQICSLDQVIRIGLYTYLGEYTFNLDRRTPPSPLHFLIASSALSKPVLGESTTINLPKLAGEGKDKQKVFSVFATFGSCTDIR